MVFVQGSHKLHGQPPARAASSSSNAQGGKHPQHLGNAQVVPALSMPCCLQLWQDVAWQRGCFIDGCGCLGICLPARFDPPTHLFTPPWSSAPSLPPLWHFILPHSRLGYGKRVRPCRCGGLRVGLVTQVHGRSSNPTASPGSPSQLLSRALRMCGQSRTRPESRISARATLFMSPG